ncbi:hypothetical protein GUJ93_ZPchr0006g41208 [Zizania palustris]|uniref:UBX domain-containing protein n=1 Tax=Zizania palustris TaxID=103762 RepID=A0A8J5QZL2_ZIZPA|nr:hypothetical protein GUJ93_ZPchr0024g29062 [Zizania palustris]KAG8071597.1 hypothetical protein GUJ93_ZPchr0006g41208 [Zizania palustris]
MEDEEEVGQGREEDGESSEKRYHDYDDEYGDSTYDMETDEDDDRYYDIEETPSPQPSHPQPAKKSLAELYRRPYEIMYHADFHSAKGHAARLDRWLLLNLQSDDEFTSHLHNRDLWANEVIGQVVKENFVFSLLVKTMGGYDDECSKVCCFYKLEDQLPAVLVIDPVTGQMLAKWSGAIQPDDFLVNIEEYIKSKPSLRSKPKIFQRTTMPGSSASAGESGELQEPEAASAPEVAMIEAHAVTVDDDDDQPLEGEKMYRLRIRFPDGSVAAKEFGCKRRVAKLFAYCRSVLHEQAPERKALAFQIKWFTGGALQELLEGDASFEDLGLNRASVSLVLDTSYE